MRKKRPATVDGFKSRMDDEITRQNRGLLPPLTAPVPGKPRVRRFTNVYGNRGDLFTESKVGRIQDPERGGALKKGRPVQTAYSGDFPSKAKLAIGQANEAIDMFFKAKKKRRR